MVLVVEVVGGQLLPLLDVCHCSADKAEVLPGKADGVCCARVVNDGGHREQSLKVNILVWVLTNYVRICINDSLNQKIINYLFMAI